MKNILKAIWAKKLAWFVLIAGIITLSINGYITGGALVSCSVFMFDNDEENKIK